MTETPRMGRPPTKSRTDISLRDVSPDGLDSTFDEKQEDSMKKRKRGRPPKKRQDTSTCAVHTPEGSKPDDRQGSSVTPKRGRGRPPKIRQHDSEDIESTRQELDSSYNEKQEGSTTKKRRRGRPSKNRQDTSLNADVSPGVANKDESSETKTRRRSRPQKYTQDISPYSDTTPGGLDSSHDEKQDGFRKIKRGRGRPPKKLVVSSLDTDSDHEDRSETDVSEKRKHPGRPKSVVNLNEEYTCVHCGVVLTSAQMCLHMLRDHYRVWKPSNQEGTINLMRVIKRFGKLKCQQCEKQFNSAQYYSYHVKWCGREDERAICPICNSNQKAMWLHAHILEHKRKRKEKTPVEGEPDRPKTKRKAATKALEHLKDLDLVEDSNTKKQKEPGYDFEKDIFNVDDYDDDDSDLDEYDDDSDVDEDGGAGQFGRSSSNKRTPYRRDVEKRNFGVEAYQLTKNRLAKYSGVTVLPSLLPCLSAWQKLTQSEAECYLPTEMTSIKFEVSHVMKNETQKVNDPQQLTFGESHLMEDGFIAYCGGAIWALDWCPAAEKTGEFLAVACHRDFDHVTPVDHSTTGPGLIQLWNLGQVQHKTNYMKLSTEEKRFPKLECIIAIDDGVILGMKWCPLGGSTDNTKTDQPERLGLLAVATTSGFIHLYSIPKLDCLQTQTELDGSYNTYKVQPSQKLCQNFNSQPDSPCLCISWSVSPELTRLAAGFGDGSISVWNLSSSSTLDHDISDNNNIIMWPCITFMAHEAPVSGVDFCPTSSDLLISCGFERNLRRWDLRDPDLILENSLLRSKLQHACWPPFFNIILTVSDQCYAANTTATYCIESCEDSTNSINIFLHDGCAWDVNYSHWTNGYIVCDVTGDVFYMVLPRVWCVKAQQKSFYSRRMSLLKITKRLMAEQMSPDDDVTTEETTDTANGNLETENTNTKPAEDTSEAAATVEMRSTKTSWKDCLKKYILDFGFFTKDAPYRHVTDELKPLDYKTILEPAMQSVNRVVFSPNATCYTWAACGGQAGLLCVKKVPTLIDKLPIPSMQIIL